jgi:hypothetical protein
MTLTLDAFHGTGELTVMVGGANQPPKLAIGDAVQTEMVPAFVGSATGFLGAAYVIEARSGPPRTPGLWTITLPCKEREEARLCLEIDGTPYYATARWPAPVEDMAEAPAPKGKVRVRKRS